jgi:hypothetical protein
MRQLAGKKAAVAYYTTAEAESMQKLLPKLLGEEGAVKSLCWVDGKLR